MKKDMTLIDKIRQLHSVGEAADILMKMKFSYREELLSFEDILIRIETDPALILDIALFPIFDLAVPKGFMITVPTPLSIVMPGAVAVVDYFVPLSKYSEASGPEELSRTMVFESSAPGVKDRILEELILDNTALPVYDVEEHKSLIRQVKDLFTKETKDSRGKMKPASADVLKHSETLRKIVTEDGEATKLNGRFITNGIMVFEVDHRFVNRKTGETGTVPRGARIPHSLVENCIFFEDNEEFSRFMMDNNFAKPR